MKGTVKWYNARKGYGFITPEDSSGDVFVHATSLKDCGLKKLYTGSEVSFDISQDEKGKRAKSIKVTKEVRLQEDQKKDTKDTKGKEEKTEKKDTKDSKKDTKKKEEKTEKKDTKDSKKDTKGKEEKTEKKKKKPESKKKGSSKK